MRREGASATDQLRGGGTTARVSHKMINFTLGGSVTRQNARRVHRRRAKTAPGIAPDRPTSPNTWLASMRT